MKILKYSSILILTTIMVACVPYKNIPSLKTFQDIQYRAEVNKIMLPDNIELAYTDEGQGKETIIFVHGLGSYIPAWDKVIPELSKTFRCIAIDLPGYGKSSKAPHSGMMSFYADVINDFAAAMNLDKFSLAGHSMGGQIGMVYSLKWPDKLNQLILVDPAGFEPFTTGQRDWFEGIMTPSLVRLTTFEAIESNLASNFYNVPKDAEFMITDRMAMRYASDFEGYCHAVSKSVAGMVNEPVIDKLQDIQTPTLIFFGENDNLIPNRYLNPGRTLDIAESGHAKIPQSELVMVPKCGHFMMFEKPSVFIQEVLKFLK